MLSIIIKAIIFARISSVVLGSVPFCTNATFCGDETWFAYEDEKCIKLIETFATKEQAEDICNDLITIGDTSVPVLLSIKSENEQKIVQELLYVQSDVKVGIWVSATRDFNNTNFKWNDGSNLIYYNWAKNNPNPDPNKNCVILQSKFTRDSENHDYEIDGKWKNVHCGTSNLIACQKNQRWSYTEFQKIFLKTRELLKNQIDELEEKEKQQQQATEQLKQVIEQQQQTIDYLKQNPVPIGFIYTQLPGQPEPRSIWPLVRWSNITSQYAGLFFRVLGGNSGQWGETQSESCPRITGVSFNEWPNPGYNNISLRNGWSSNIRTGNYKEEPSRADGIRFYTNHIEVRPINKAIQLWKRIS